jgi:Flp pilus assembly pilin Flp
VLLTDLTPTIAHLAGVELDEASIEGRAVERRDGPDDGAARRATLVDAEAAARFRDQVLVPVVLSVVISVSVLSLAAVAVLLGGWAKLRPVLAQVALVLLAFPSLTYLAAVFPFYDWGTAAYWAFLVLGSVLVGLLAWMFGGRWLGPLAITYGLLVGVVTVSIVALGSRLQLATVFGDSPIVAGRFTGINNVTFAYFFLAGSMLACIAVDRYPGERGRRLMLAILGGVLLVDVAPMWGADVGGALAGLPALALVAMGLGQWKVRWRTVVIAIVATVVLLGLLGWLDLMRDSADRSHLGRLLERIGSDGSAGLTTVVERKLAVNLRSLTESTWRYIFGPLAVAAGLMLWKGRRWGRAVAHAFPALRRALPGLAALAVLGYGANDSGIAVPAAMLAVAVPGFVYLACRVEPAPIAEGD